MHLALRHYLPFDCVGAGRFMGRWIMEMQLPP
jgi:hypothetical protein